MMQRSDSDLLLAGAAMVDITPAAGTHLAGSAMGERRPARTVLDPLFAKAVILTQGDRRICLVTLDVTIVDEPYTTQIRQGIADRAGVPVEAVMVHGIQTHSAPGLGRFMLDPDFPLETTPETEYLWGSESAYAEKVTQAAIQAAVDAASRLQPARIGVGRGILGGVAFNRRGIRRDGTIMMPKPAGRENQPLGLTDLCYLEGPIDPEVGVACIQGLDMRPMALLLHYTCHPVHIFGQAETYHAVSADWPGAWAREMQRALGADVVPLVVNGCCGNTNPWHPFDPDCRPNHLRMGRELAAMAQRVVHTLRYAERATLDWRLDHVALPYREIPEERLRQVADLMAQHPEPPRGPTGEVDPRWFAAASTRSVELCRAREPAFAYEIQTLRIGDLALVGLPGEPFVEGQLAIKVGSAAPYTFVAHLTTRYVGYLPTAQAYTRGGHEANGEVTYWAKLAPGCLETVVERTRALVHELFAG